MRALYKSLAIALLFTLVGLAQAQQQFFKTGRPSLAFGATGPIVNQPIDVGLNSGAFSSGNFIGTMFRKMSLTNWQKTQGVSPLPAPSSFPSTQYPNKINPLPPVIPK